MDITLGKDKYSLVQPKLRKWIEIEDLRSKLEIATDTRTFIDYYFGLVSVAIGISLIDLEEIEWEDVAIAYTTAIELQKPTIEFPMFKINQKVGTEEWNYDGRSWYSWLHLLAKEYGWNVEYIADLEVDDAVGLLHEILADEYFDKEWEWGLSEIAYPYDSNTKKSSYKPLPKPEWMLVNVVEKKVKRMKKIKIRKDMLPRGMVVLWKENEDAEHKEGDSTIQSY